MPGRRSAPGGRPGAWGSYQWASGQELPLGNGRQGSPGRLGGKQHRGAAFVSRGVKTILSTLCLLLLLIVPARLRAQVVNPTTPPEDTALVNRREREKVQPREADKVFANPSVLGMGPSRGIVLRYERSPRFGVTSTSSPGLLGNGADEVKRFNTIEFKAYAPLWNRPHFKIVAGFNYARQQFNFEGRGKPDLYPLYQVLDDRNLRTIGSQLVVLRPIDGRRYYLFRVKGELNGDYQQDAEDGQYRRLPLNKYLRTSAEFFYGWKRSPMQSLAIGAQFGYTFGRRSIYPAIIYNRTWNDRWGLETILPARVRVRYNASERSLFYGGYEVEGNSYTINIDVPTIGPNQTVELRVTSLATKFRFERELLPVLWFGLEAGYRYYASFRVFDSTTDRNRLIDNKLKGSAVVSAEIFLTPPRRILKQ